jgi:HlyD family secretion protein
VSAAIGDINLIITADAEVEAINVVEVKSKASGEIISLPWESGDHVEEGAVLAQLDTRTVLTQLSQAEADLEVARANIELMQKTLERKKDLREKGLISEEEYDRAVLEARQAEAALVAAQAQKENADERLEDTTLRAPFSGVILDKHVEEGQIIASGTSLYSAGTTLLTLAELSRVRIVANIDETDVGSIREGVDVSITVDAFPEKSYRGRVLKVEPRATLEQNVITFPVVTEIDNADGKLFPGMTAEIEIVAEERNSVLTLPSEAVYDAKTIRILAAQFDVTIPNAPNAGGQTKPGQPGQKPAPGAGGGPGGRPNLPREQMMQMRAGVAQGGGDPQARQRMPGVGSGEQAGMTGKPSIGFVLLKRGDSLEVKRVLTGLNNYEQVEILRGIGEGDEVLLVTQSRALLDQQRFRERFQQSRGMPGTRSR